MTRLIAKPNGYPGLLLFTLLLLTACGKDAPTATERVGTEPRDTLAPAVASPERLVAWVNDLNVRATPAATASIVTRVGAGEILVFAGETSDGTETIVLRGMAFTEPWLRVRTGDGTEGWVFGGAVKPEGSFRGQGYQGAGRFAFPAFGDFDLREWNRLPTRSESGGDAEITVTTYERDGRQLTIERAETGEYGYRNNYTLTDKRENILKQRTFTFEVDPERRITESVIDRTVSPPVRYYRSQLMDSHFMQLNARPELATGEWEVERLAE